MSSLRGLHSNTGNCGPTALYNMAAYYARVGFDDMLSDTTYTEIISLTGFQLDSDTPKGVSYSVLQICARQYIRNQGYNASVTDYWFDTWSEFVDDFRAVKANLIYVEDDSIGHFMLGIGYRVLNDGSKYIRVLDGIVSRSNRFIAFKGENTNEFKGASVSVSR